MAKQIALDQHAWAQFQTRLRGYVRRRVDPAAVDDVLGGILLRLVQSQDSLAAARNPIAWALRVAGNAISDHHRRRASEQRALSQAEIAAGLQERHDDDPAPPRSEELARCILPLVRSLPEPYAQALLLTDIKGLTQAEAALRLNLSISGAKSRVQRGRQKLKDALLRCCIVETDSRGDVIDYRRRPDGRRLRC